MVYSARRQVLLILLCVAWIEFAIHFSPQIEVRCNPGEAPPFSHHLPVQELAHKALNYKSPAVPELLPLAYGDKEEHSRLLQSLERSNGKWDVSHPRHRLLTALYGFSRYNEGSQSDLNRWKDLYKKVPKRQRLVKFPDPPNKASLTNGISSSSLQLTILVN